MSTSNLLRLFLLAAIWGGSFLFMRIAAPVLGDWSDRWGRRPVIILSLVGTTFSFVLFRSEREEGVTIGHGAVVHGMFIGRGSLIGMGATILDHAHIGAESLVGANSLVPQGFTCPPGSLVLGTPANIGYMSGALKHFFDQIYYPVLDDTRGRPYGLYVHGNLGTEGAVRAVEDGMLAGGKRCALRRVSRAPATAGSRRSPTDGHRDLGRSPNSRPKTYRVAS